MKLPIAHAGFIVRAEGKSAGVPVDYADSAPHRAPSSTQSGQFERGVDAARYIIELKCPGEALRMRDEFACTVLEISPDCVRRPDAAGRLPTRRTARACAAWRSTFLRPGTAAGHTKSGLDGGFSCYLAEPHKVNEFMDAREIVLAYTDAMPSAPRYKESSNGNCN